MLFEESYLIETVTPVKDDLQFIDENMEEPQETDYD